MFYHNLDPVLFQLGPLTVRYYGLVFAAGILFSFLVIRHLARKRQLPLSGKDFDELLLLGAAGVIIGGRLGHVISKIGDYASDPIQVLAVWNGGMAFHGAFLGLVLAGIFFARRKKISFYDVADLAVIPASLALVFGRVANFINGEFFGTPTSLPWGVKFQNVEGFRHPVQLYEAAKNLLIFAALWFLKDKGFPKGTLFWLFVFLYGSVRFALEFVKVVPDYVLGLTWGQFWSLPMIVLGGFMLWRLKCAGKPAKAVA